MGRTCTLRDNHVRPLILHAPVELPVPAVPAVLPEALQEERVGRDERGVLARERKPLAALAPVVEHLLPHARAVAPQVRLLHGTSSARWA